MLSKLTKMQNCGIFENNSKLDIVFRKRNLIYGFNGSGKTTISRMIESLSKSGLSDKLDPNADFQFETSDNTKIDPDNTSDILSNNIFVYSEDFIARNLGWNAAEVQPIVYLGKKSKELSEELENKESALSENTSALDAKQKEFKSAENAASSHLRERANTIYEALNLGRGYNARSLSNDYKDIKTNLNDTLNEQEISRLKQAINPNSPLEKIDTFLPSLDLEATYTQYEEAMNQSLVKVAIEALENRKDALPWIKQGLNLHESEVECLFCGNTIADERKEQLEEALSGGFDQFTQKLSQAQTAISNALKKVENCRATLTNISSLHPTLEDEFKKFQNTAVNDLELIKNDLNDKVFLLSQKQTAPASELKFSPTIPSEILLNFVSHIHSIQEFIGKHNRIAENYEKQIEQDKCKLKRHYLHETASAYQELCIKKQQFETERDVLSRNKTEFDQQIRDIKTKLSDIGPATDAINEMLKSYLGHSEISLAVHNETYAVCRNGEPSDKPLSEGEKTAIAFCYFLSSLKSEGRKLKDLIVVIDDPISSLDSKSIFHVVSLVRNQLNDCKQLFILTHNHEFMREMKKWIGMGYKETYNPQTGNSRLPNSSLLFTKCHIQEDRKRISEIVEMPKLLREYESEYHYLYSIVKNIAEDQDNFSTFSYLMPNAMRKLLEIFLAFKEPGNSGLAGKVNSITKNYKLDSHQIKGMEYLVALESHGDNIGDVDSFSSFTLDQISDAAVRLMEMIECVDPTHKKAMDKLCK